MNGVTEKVYELIRDPIKNQEKAKEYCERQEKKLASIMNEMEQRVFDEATDGESWIGLERDGDDDPWRWSSGEPFPEDKDWLDSGSNGNCMRIKSKTQWEPDDCSQEKGFLCYGGELYSEITCYSRLIHTNLLCSSLTGSM